MLLQTDSNIACLFNAICNNVTYVIQVVFSIQNEMLDAGIPFLRAEFIIYQKKLITRDA